MLGIARERIRTLHEISMHEKDSQPDFAKRHIEIMESIAMRTDITLPRPIKRSYCKKCKIPYGASTRMRLKRGKVVLITCGNCGEGRRFGYARK